MLRGMDEGDQFEVDPIFKDDQCILRKPICVSAARRHPGFRIRGGESVGWFGGVDGRSTRRGGYECNIV